jgi:hypothetical protein
LTLSFPYPILVNEISAILHSTDRFICIGIEERMVGAVRSRGRLSFEFQSNEEWKWNVGSLKTFGKSCDPFQIEIWLHRIGFPSSIAI